MSPAAAPEGRPVGVKIVIYFEAAQPHRAARVFTSQTAHHHDVPTA
jgi:hypothetical protein